MKRKRSSTLPAFESSSRPNPRKTSICRGLQLIAKALDKTDADYGRWVAALG